MIKLCSVTLLCLVGASLCSIPLQPIDDSAEGSGTGGSGEPAALRCTADSRRCVCRADVALADRVCASDGQTYDSVCTLCCAKYGERAVHHLQLAHHGEC